MNPVDELYDLLRTADYQGNVTDEDCLDRADDLIAAGWRLVPEGSVVVPKSVWDDAYSFIFAATDEYGGGFDGRDKFSEGHDILYRMIDATHPSRAALEDADA